MCGVADPWSCSGRRRDQPDRRYDGAPLCRRRPYRSDQRDWKRRSRRVAAFPRCNREPKGEFKISKSSAEGLVNGLDNALGQVAADQADKVRVCLQPVRERLLDVMLPPKQGTGQTVTAPGGVAVGGDVKYSPITIGPPAQTPGK